MDEIGRSERALAALVYSRRAREAWRASGPSALGLAPDEAAAFAALDPIALERQAAAVRQLVLGRSHRGTGGLREWFPRTIAAWRAAFPDDAELDELVTRLLDSPAGSAWRESAQDELGLSLEEAFFRFAEAAAIGDPAVREQELLGCIVGALAIDPEPAFLLPPSVRRAPAGWFAVAARGAPELYAALPGRLLRGPITPLLAALLEGAELARAAAACNVSVADATAARAALEGMGLLAAIGG
jgi:hypothetical protein